MDEVLFPPLRQGKKIEYANGEKTAGHIMTYRFISSGALEAGMKVSASV